MKLKAVAAIAAFAVIAALAVAYRMLIWSAFAAGYKPFMVYVVPALFILVIVIVPIALVVFVVRWRRVIVGFIYDNPKGWLRALIRLIPPLLASIAVNLVRGVLRLAWYSFWVVLAAKAAFWFLAYWVRVVLHVYTGGEPCYYTKQVLGITLFSAAFGAIATRTFAWIWRTVTDDIRQMRAKPNWSRSVRVFKILAASMAGLGFLVVRFMLEEFKFPFPAGTDNDWIRLLRAAIMVAGGLLVASGAFLYWLVVSKHDTE